MIINYYNIDYCMDSHILNYCKHICKVQVEVLRFNRKKKVWYWDLPAMATICHNHNKSKFAKGYSHKPQGTKWHNILRLKLERLGEIGEKPRAGNGYIIGNCAEQHAGNNYMNKYRESHLNNLYFTEAVRPRTKEVFPSCNNCKSTFPNL